MQAICYYRFSTMAQADGNSIDRQRADCLAMIDRNGWTLVEELEDQGLSAFSGEHLASGKLGRFAAKALSGGYPAGTVLVIERLDRISRADMWVANDWMRSIINAGVAIATADGSKIYPAYRPLSISDGFESMLKQNLNNEESVKKADRLAAAFADKRARLSSGHIMTKATPPWLKVADIDGKPTIIVIPERVDIVKRIFAMADEGLGRDKIAARLNREEIPAWGHTAKGWYRSYISNILKNAAVIGEMQTFTRRKIPGSAAKTRRTPIDEVRKGYFPAVIEIDQFARLNSAELKASRAHMGVRGDKLVNLLAGLMRCAECQGIMTLQSKAKAGSIVIKRKPDGGTRTSVRGVDESYLVCNNSQRGQCEFRQRYRYEIVLKRVLDSVLHLSMDDALFSNVADTTALAKRVSEIGREIGVLAKRSETLFEMVVSTVGTDGHARTEKAWQDTETATAALKIDLKAAEAALTEARGAVAPEVHIARVNEVRFIANDPDPEIRFVARAKIMAALRSTVEFVKFNYVGGMWALNLKAYHRTFVFYVDSKPAAALANMANDRDTDVVAEMKRREINLSAFVSRTFPENHNEPKLKRKR